VVLCWAFDRLARSVRHFLEVLDELNHLGIEFISFREKIDTGGPLGRAVAIIVGAIAAFPTLPGACRPEPSLLFRFRSSSVDRPRT
jgi:DNA invertase Pin-like site-specific DNA recombinase